MTDNNENFKVESTPVQNVIALDQTKRAAEPIKPGVKPAAESLEGVVQNTAAAASMDDQPNEPVGDSEPEDNWDAERTEVLTGFEETKAAKAWLVDQDGNIHEMNTYPFVIGREEKCNLTPAGRGISRRHIEITLQSGRFIVVDLDSVNGLKVNGYQVTRVILEDNDEISVGDCTLTFRHREPESDGSDGLTFVPSSASSSSDGLFAKAKNSVRFNLKSAGMMLAGLLLCFIVIQSFQGTDVDELAVVTAPAEPVAKETEAKVVAEVEAPPQVIASSNVGQIQRGGFEPLVEEEPVVVAPVAPKVVKPQPIDAETKAKLAAEKRRRIASEKATSAAKKTISNANNLYMQGNAKLVISELSDLSNSKLVSSKTRKSASRKLKAISGLYAQYSRGLEAFNVDDKEVAFTEWTKFLSAEKKVFPSERSIYATDVSAKAVAEYLAKARAAQEAGDHHLAYNLWTSAVKMNNSTEAKLALSAVDNKVRMLYRKGLKYEYVNSEKAKSLWNEILGLVPVSNEYYTKANAKLSWYQRWGVE